MISIIDPQDCCGCTACASICPHDAIKMKPDALGFCYPMVDKNKCNDCGLCEKVCSFHHDYNRIGLFENPLVYGAYNRKQEIVSESQSGGLFFTIAEHIISVGGGNLWCSFSKCYKSSSCQGNYTTRLTVA